MLDVQKTSVANVTKATSIQRRRTSLLKRILNYISSRPQYMPGLQVYLRDTETSEGEEVSMATPEYIPLHLPSSLPSEKWPSVFISGLAEVEDRLRFAQACEALTELRCQLTKRTYASRYRTANVSSQNHYTRFWELQDQTDSKIKAACSRYRLARKGLVNLRGSGDWEKKLQELRPEDVRGLSEKALINEETKQGIKTRELAGISGAVNAFNDIELQDQNLPQTVYNPHLAVGEGHRTLSWIWYSTGTTEILGDTTTRIGSCESLLFAR